MSTKALLKAVEHEFTDIASTHKQVVWKEECEFALQKITTNKMLQECYPESIQAAIKNVASVGLTLNPAHGLAYLIPESKKIGNQFVKECQLRISFMGLLKLATDSGSIKWAKAEIVRASDTFKYMGVNKEPTHEFNPFGDRGEPVGVYCIAKTCDGDFLVDFMPQDEINKIRSKAKTAGVWTDWPEEMAKKAMIKRAYKQWPKSNERLATAVAILNENEGSIDMDIGYSAEQFEKYNKYLNEGTPIEFAGYLDTLEDQVIMALYNSGEKGEKVKLKTRHNEKEMSGKRDIAARIGMLNSGDDEQIEEATEGLTDLEKRIIDKRANTLEHVN